MKYVVLIVSAFALFAGGEVSAIADDTDAAIKNALSAAPAGVAKDASVMLIDAKGNMTIAKKGTNGFTCLPDNPATPGPDPMCTDANGMGTTEVVTGSNGGVATSTVNFKKVLSVTASGAAAGTVSIGTVSTGATPWVRLDDWALPQTSIQCNVVGTVNATIQSTLDDPNDPTNPVAPALVNFVTVPGLAKELLELVSQMLPA